jgi:hypothetical protein
MVMLLLQANKEGLPFNGDTYCALDGAQQEGFAARTDSLEEGKGHTYQLVTYEDLPKYIDKRNPCIGTVEYVKEALRLLNIPVPKLPRNSNRDSLLLTLKEALELRESSNTNIFIKPVETKIFTGFVHEGYNYSCIKDVSPDTKVRVYDVFPSTILTEWRAYVHKHEVIHISNYSGDFFLLPNREYVESIVRCNKADFPVAYSLDVGVLADGSNVVIEYNDFWALGNYGCPNWLYIRCLIDRWREIVNGI